MLFTVVIPTYNRRESLRNCLTSLQAQRFDPSQVEIVVVDDGGSQALDELGPECTGPFPVKVVRQPNAGPGIARNTGAREARGKYLLFTDDDCIAQTEYLVDYERGFARAPRALLGGRVRTSPQANLYCHSAQMVMDMALSFFNHNPEQARFFASNNFGVARADFWDCGGFLGGPFRVASEDREFCDRWKHRGGELQALAGATVGHAPELNLSRYWEMYFRYGRGAYQYQKVRKQRGSGTLAEDSRFHLHLPRLVRKFLRSYPRRRKLGILLLLLVWQVANLLGFSYECWSDARSTTTPSDQ